MAEPGNCPREFCAIKIEQLRYRRRVSMLHKNTIRAQIAVGALFQTWLLRQIIQRIEQPPQDMQASGQIKRYPLQISLCSPAQWLSAEQFAEKSARFTFQNDIEVEICHLIVAISDNILMLRKAIQNVGMA